MTNYCYGWPSNGKVCDCGKHHGVGDLTPGNRAARYARMRDYLADIMTEDQWGYLKTWERAHGPVRYKMVEAGIHTGTFMPSRKGTVLYMPVLESEEPGKPQNSQPSKWWDD
jgi:hypothetical protein